eukprot:CAMPEP_0119036650 /NCGR_PEP_ID=MMETSP1177-20130426/4515_1 /TAXON_ID=2985 /ORGANISM="Ochromonas sp, Strain CCMP1899" /LENGTH=175 /DNA_ID=CAMNT_0006996837 /DNA_START=234 /DNA_END=761 /DNA_ORIENTATION=+
MPNVNGLLTRDGSVATSVDTRASKITINKSILDVLSCLDEFESQKSSKSGSRDKINSESNIESMFLGSALPTYQDGGDVPAGFDLQFILNSLTELAIPDDYQGGETSTKSNKTKCSCTGYDPMTALALDDTEWGGIETKTDSKKYYKSNDMYESKSKMIDLTHVVNLMNDLMEIE